MWPATPSPGSGRRGLPARRRGCRASLLPLGRRLQEAAAGRPPPPGAFREPGGGVRGPQAGGGGPRGCGGRAEPGRPQQVAGAARPPLRPPGPGLYLQRRLPSPGTEAQARSPSSPGRPSSRDARTDGPTDASGQRGGPRRSPPRRPGHRLRRGHKGQQGGRDPRSGLGDSLQPATRRHPPWVPRQRARPGPRGFWFLPVAVALAPPLPRPPRCQDNPSDACRGGEALRGAEAAPEARPTGGAADHGAPE